MNIRDAKDGDAAAICAIYNHYVAHSTISFEEDAVATGVMEQRMAAVRAAGLPWLVIEQDGALAGYAYASKWRDRHAYRYSVETTVYLAPGIARQGLGRAVYAALLARLTNAGFRVAIGGIAQPNTASVALHETLGFEKVAHFKDVGFKFGRWIDVGYWQLLLGSAS
ncbi:MAG: arsinothricin resistance N-acetyltransferase ArsN1 family B [Pseudomonadota bacterium]